MSEVILDASAILALLNQERGAAEVQAAIRAGAMVSAVNLSEVVAKLADRGLNEETIRQVIENLQFAVIPFDEDQALRAGLLRTLTRNHGLSFGDRACLALGQARSLTVMTADRAWANLSIDVTVQVVR